MSLAGWFCWDVDGLLFAEMIRFDVRFEPNRSFAESTHSRDPAAAQNTAAAGAGTHSAGLLRWAGLPKSRALAAALVGEMKEMKKKVKQASKADLCCQLGRKSKPPKNIHRFSMRVL